MQMEDAHVLLLGSKRSADPVLFTHNRLGSVWSNPRERWSANAEVLSAGGSSRWMLLPHQPSDNGRFVQSKIGGSAPLIEMLA